jgi:hypothetical protein
MAYAQSQTCVRGAKKGMQVKTCHPFLGLKEESAS